MKKGAKVELTWNMRTEVGLSHHTVGTVVDILEFEGTDDVIMVEFENYRGK